MKISIIVAVGLNNVIGYKNKLPWNHIPIDMKHFKNVTINNTVIMGRKTYESIGKKLPERNNIIITRQKNFTIDSGCSVVSNINESLEVAKQYNKKVFIIGGSEIYKQTIHLSERIYLTRIWGIFKGDSYFPEINLNKWKIKHIKHYKISSMRPYPITFFTYEKGN